MGYRSKIFGVRKVDLEDGYWVEVAPLTKAEDDECRRVLLGGDLEGQPGDVTTLRARFHQREYTDQLLLFAIKRWNLDDDGGELLPIDCEHVQGLADRHSARILTIVRGITTPLADPHPQAGARARD
jgi:hypothetical protein